VSRSRTPRLWNFSQALAFLMFGKRSKAMRRSLTSLTSAVALVGAGMGVAQTTRIEPDANVAGISTWRWTVDTILLSQKDQPKFSAVVRWAQPPAGAYRKNDF
jgi:hypothetical protein